MHTVDVTHRSNLFDLRYKLRVSRRRPWSGSTPVRPVRGGAVAQLQGSLLDNLVREEHLGREGLDPFPWGDPSSENEVARLPEELERIELVLEELRLRSCLLGSPFKTVRRRHRCHRQPADQGGVGCPETWFFPIKAKLSALRGLLRLPQAEEVDGPCIPFQKIALDCAPLDNLFQELGAITVELQKSIHEALLWAVTSRCRRFVREFSKRGPMIYFALTQLWELEWDLEVLIMEEHPKDAHLVSALEILAGEDELRKWVSKYTAGPMERKFTIEGRDEFI
eukprot:Polyplicarium_translucidae@DN3377_c2_g1_i15.p1